MHKLDMGIGLGPAVHLSPYDRLGIHAYFRFSPTVSLVTHNFAGDEDGKFELVTGYASYFSTGLPSRGAPSRSAASTAIGEDGTAGSASRTSPCRSKIRVNCST